MTGRIFNVHGGYINRRRRMAGRPERQQEGTLGILEKGLSDVIPDLVAKAGPTTDITGTIPEL